MEFKSKITNSAATAHDSSRRIINDILLSGNINDGTAVPNYSSSKRTIERKRRKRTYPHQDELHLMIFIFLMT